MHTNKISLVRTVLLVSALFICSFSYALDYTNLIPNGDFNAGQSGWSGTVTNITVDGENVYVGKDNVTLVNKITLKPHTTYNVRCKFMKADGAETMTGGLFALEFYDANDNEIINTLIDFSNDIIRNDNIVEVLSLKILFDNYGKKGISLKNIKKKALYNTLPLYIENNKICTIYEEKEIKTKIDVSLEDIKRVKKTDSFIH